MVCNIAKTEVRYGILRTRYWRKSLGMFVHISEKSELTLAQSTVPYLSRSTTASASSLGLNLSH